jgi:SAM-dependent methyltransferase
MKSSIPPLNSYPYNQAYYTNNNYAGYLERFERYEKMVQELEYELFRILKLDFKYKPVLDYGCGVGFVVKGFRNLGYSKVFGYDHSEWAIDWGRKNLFSNDPPLIDSELRHTLHRLGKENVNLMTAFDVFEHMSEFEIIDVLNLYTPKHILVRIPLTKEDGGKFILPVSEADPTHITRLTRESWMNFFTNNDYTFLFNINLGNIYDTDGVMCAMFRHI